ncbi:MAG: cation transporter [Clostridia bacterium]|nr:cation transporter [Clostridia bacterium]
MKTQKNIFVAFILNLAFSIFEFVGGALSGSVAIISDAVHDFGDATSIGFSYFLERKSKKQPDETYTYGYSRYSVFGGLITTLILLLGSVIVIYNAIIRIINPVDINYNVVIILAVVGVSVNFFAAWFTKGGHSLNQKAVNLHMLEDVLGWLVVLIGAIVMRLTDFYLIDPIMSILVAIFIIINAVKNMKEVVNLLLEKTPRDIKFDEIKRHICQIEGVKDVHHVHVWSIDGINNCATMHVVTDADSHEIKVKVKQELMEHGINHATLELESSAENCHDKNCHVDSNELVMHHHHHH